MIEVARRTVAAQLAEPRNRELLADLPPGDPRKIHRPEGPPSEWPDWRELLPELRRLSQGAPASVGRSPYGTSRPSQPR